MLPVLSLYDENWELLWGLYGETRCCICIEKQYREHSLVRITQHDLFIIPIDANSVSSIISNFINDFLNNHFIYTRLAHFAATRVITSVGSNEFFESILDELDS